MTASNNAKITVAATINAPLEKVWECWTNPKHIMQWNNASDDWHTPYAENDCRTGGKFLSRMAAKDGSFSFDFEGIYDKVSTHEHIAYSLADARTVQIDFTSDGTTTTVTETFDPENENPAEMQRSGWQSIMDNFKKHVEQHP